MVYKRQNVTWSLSRIRSVKVSARFYHGRLVVGRNERYPCPCAVTFSARRQSMTSLMTGLAYSSRMNAASPP
jgi:hypothetical protein